jgi:hypothetical protein
MNIINKIGLEAEFFLRDKDGKLVYPAAHGFSTDDFCIIGEFRGDPGATRAEAIGLFMKAYYEIAYKAKGLGLTLDIAGWTTIEPAFYAEILRKMGSKSVAQCRNVYGTDILTLSDAETTDGKVIAQRVSAGLHVHFSSESVATQSVSVPAFESVKLPLNIGGAEAVFDLFRRTGQTDQKVTARASRITNPVIESFVRHLDAKLLPSLMLGLPPLKYRSQGFYETKHYGFEYRSLPFNKMALDNLSEIVDQSFKLLESL